MRKITQKLVRISNMLISNQLVTLHIIFLLIPFNSLAEQLRTPETKDTKCLVINDLSKNIYTSARIAINSKNTELAIKYNHALQAIDEFNKSCNDAKTFSIILKRHVPDEQSGVSTNNFPNISTGSLDLGCGKNVPCGIIITPGGGSSTSAGKVQELRGISNGYPVEIYKLPPSLSKDKLLQLKQKTNN